MRLIDADVLKERILEERDAIPTTIVERYSLGVPTPNKHGNSMRGGIRIALRCMEQTPTIEAEPVRHGRWVMTVYTTTSKRGRIISNAKFECSECGYSNGRKRNNYCPNCGAKMDLEVEQ